MTHEAPGRISGILQRAASGDATAADELLPLVYDELRALARAHFRRQAADHTLQPTALVHEVYLRLVRQEDGAWRDRAHFYAVAATAMRQILTDHNRRRLAQKRGGDLARVTLDDVATPQQGAVVDLIHFQRALEGLEAVDARATRIVELRYFGGLSVKEAAEVTGQSISSVERQWRAAKAWLRRELSR